MKKSITPYVLAVNTHFYYDEQFKFYPIRKKKDMTDIIDDYIDQLPDNYDLDKMDVIIYEASKIII